MAPGLEAGGECGICYEAFWVGGGGRAPQQLPCGHVLCRSCLRKLLCFAAAVTFLSCPFCRMVTLLPELPLEGPEATRRGEEEQEEDGGAPADGRQASGRSVAVELSCGAPGPVFAVSGLVSPYGGTVSPYGGTVSPYGLRRGSEAPGNFLLGLLGRGLLLDTQPPLASMENLRLGFAAGILILIVSTFFLLVFLK